MTGRVRVDGPPITGVTETKPLVPRADFRVDDFFAAIDNHGARLAWARAMKCPCKPVNQATNQPNPLCKRCNGGGWAYFGPRNYVVPPAVGQLDLLQQALVQQYGASVIRGIFYGMTKRDERYGKIGPWFFGQGMVTVRAENVIAYHDRLVDLDSELAYSEIVTVAPDRPTAIATRYPIIGLNWAEDDSGTVYVVGGQILLDERGRLSWREGKVPKAGARIALHFLCHAHWRVSSLPHAMRRTQTKVRKANPTTPLGDPTALPIQAAVELDFLTDDL